MNHVQRINSWQAYNPSYPQPTHILSDQILTVVLEIWNKLFIVRYLSWSKQNKQCLIVLQSLQNHTKVKH